MRSWGGLGPQSNEVGAWLKQSLIAHLDEPLHELPDAPFVGGDPSFIFFPRLPRPLHDRWLRVESTPLRPRGGIGRRNGLKIHRPYGHTGSTPVEAIDLICWGGDGSRDVQTGQSLTLAGVSSGAAMAAWAARS